MVLTYHSLDESGSVISTTPAIFRDQMAFLKGRSIPVLPLTSITAANDGVAITFDDGFLNFYEHAFPVLVEFGMTATVFVVSGYCGIRNDWPSQPGGIPAMRLMGWPELKEIVRYGISLGAHTVTHPSLSSLKQPEIVDEMARSRREIEDHTGAAVETFAYPYGDAPASARKYARRHFRLSCTTEPASVPGFCDPAGVPRIDTYYLRNRLWFESLPTIRGQGYLLARRALRAVRQTFTG
jgi:peptidoglycan/xylan/chitin deacetylase (PgdA/CDA1 family)